MVEVIEAGHRTRAVATLTLAFAADPVMRFFWPDPARYASSFPRFAEAYGGRAFDRGTAHWLADGRGVALWLAPGVRPDDEALGAVLTESLDGETLSDLSGAAEQMARFRPDFDHWYLALAGVDPPAQGRGLGSALLHHALQSCDEDGLPAYLEASSPASRALYERHGFEVVGVVQAGSSPPMWSMFRAPRPEH